EIGGGLRQDARRVADGNAALRAGGDVDVVVADREVAHDLELRAGTIEELVIDAVREERQDAVAALDGLEERIAGRWQVVLPDLRVTGLEDEAQAVVGDDTRDEDLRAGHAARAQAVATSGATKVRIRPSASVRFSRELA